jgi:DNA-binding transcriptional MerR regulator
MLIGELSKVLDVTPKALRHYEKIGLIPAAQRSRNGYRAYSDAAIARARLVVALRKLDLPLDTVRELLAEKGDQRTLRQRLMGQLDEQIQAYELRVAVLQGKRDDLQARYDALVTTPQECSGDCICGALLQPCSCGDVPLSERKTAFVGH